MLEGVQAAWEAEKAFLLWVGVGGGWGGGWVGVGGVEKPLALGRVLTKT